MGLRNIGSRTSSQGKTSPLEAMGTRLSGVWSRTLSVRLVGRHSRTGSESVIHCLFLLLEGSHHSKVWRMQQQERWGILRWRRTRWCRWPAGQRATSNIDLLVSAITVMAAPNDLMWLIVIMTWAVSWCSPSGNNNHKLNTKTNPPQLETYIRTHYNYFSLGYNATLWHLVLLRQFVGVGYDKYLIFLTIFNTWYHWLGLTWRWEQTATWPLSYKSRLLYAGPDSPEIVWLGFVLKFYTLLSVRELGSFTVTYCFQIQSGRLRHLYHRWHTLSAHNQYTDQSPIILKNVRKL